MSPHDALCLGFQLGALNEATRRIGAWRVRQGADPGHNDPIVLRARLMGLVSECAEAYQALRPGRHNNFREELADIFIRWAGLVGMLGIDIEQEIAQKMAVNIARDSREVL